VFDDVDVIDPEFKPQTGNIAAAAAGNDESTPSGGIGEKRRGQMPQRSDIYVKTVVKDGKVIRKEGRTGRIIPSEDEVDQDTHTTLVVQFVTESGEPTAAPMEIPKNITPEQLQVLINTLLNNEDKLPYSFYLDEEEIIDTLQAVVTRQEKSIEGVLNVVYRPQALFRVTSVTRCTSSLPGHEEAILHVSFSSDGKHLASGSGDATVRIWDVMTETPKLTLRGHRGWVMAVAWSPNGKKLASGAMDKEIRIWNPETGRPIGKTLKGHTDGVIALAWEPMLADVECSRLASASRDGTIRVWDTIRSVQLFLLSGHTKPIRALKWGGCGLIYSGSVDRSVRAWDVKNQKLFRLMEGHGHWVNSLSMNTEAALRSGPYNHRGEAPTDAEEIRAVCRAKYEEVTRRAGGELLVSASDDFTLFLWRPLESAKPIARLTGHQQPVNFVSFSPDGLYIASASFDKSVRIWNGLNGKFYAAFRMHVQAVYQCAWSADSRLLVSSSKDSTIKLWDISKKKMIEDLPGHADEVYAVDWSPDGERVCSGGRDRVLKVWRN